jgi:hypothetical protein
MLEHLRTPVSGIDSTSRGLWKLIYAISPWDANGGIGSYYKDKIIRTSTDFCSSGSGISIKPDVVEQASVYNSCGEPPTAPTEWLFAWTKQDYNNEIIGIHALFSGEVYKQVSFQWPGARDINRTMQQPLYTVLTTIAKGDRSKSSTLVELV